jgi:hypothetical protein
MESGENDVKPKPNPELGKVVAENEIPLHKEIAGQINDKIKRSWV